MNQKKNKSYVKTKRVSVRVTEDEFIQCLKKAENRHMTVSELIRSSILPYSQNVGQSG